MNKFIPIIFLILISPFLSAQNNFSIYKAYASSDMKKWKFSMDSLNSVKQKSYKDILDLINYQYGYIAWCVSEESDEEAELYLEKARKNISFLEQKNYNLSTLFAYKAAFIGFEIGISPYKAPFYGPKSIEYAKKSLEIDSLNHMTYIQMGNIAYYTPSIFGGSKMEAIKHYLKSLMIMEKNKDLKINNWNYLNLLTAIINAYMGQNQYVDAKKYCEKTLKAEPEFVWVRNKLYPDVLKRISNE